MPLPPSAPAVFQIRKSLFFLMIFVLGMAALCLADGLEITTSRIPLAKQSQSISFQLYASGGAPPYTWQVSGLDGSGIQWSQSGFLWGTAEGIGSYNLTVQVFDA